MGENYKFKIIMLGDFGVGKTSLVRRYVHDIFDDRYMTTIGVKVSKKEISLRVDQDICDITLLLWDIAGEATFNNVAEEYLRGAAGGIFVGDLTRVQTMASMNMYVSKLYAANPKARCIIALNKTDLCPNAQAEIARAVEALKSLTYADNVKSVGTSAKDGSNVQELFERLSRMIVENLRDG